MKYRSVVCPVAVCPVAALTLACLAALFAHAGGAEDRPPNVLFILVDDLGWADLGCYGSKYHESPHIDRLAEQGLRFTDAYAASPVCSSTRASLMTGRYPARVGITDFIPGHWRPWERLVVPAIKDHLPLEEVTIAEPLKSAGYATCYLGKWHLGGREHYPDKQGFDRTIVAGGGRHFGNSLSGDLEESLAADEYLTERLTDEAIRFIGEHREEPFFVYLAHYTVHIPLEARLESIARFEKKAADAAKAPASHPIYAAMIADLDASIGRLMAQLAEWQLDDNTVVIFFSDNGGLIRRFDGGGPAVSPQTPLRAEKGTLYEGGIRVPLIVRWPGVVEPGGICAEPVTSVDMLPTILNAAGLPPVTGREIDGVSLLPLLQGEKSLAREAIYFHYPHYHHMDPAGAVRAGRWKLIEHYDDGEVELYDLSRDPGESRNLAGDRDKETAELKRKLAAWREAVSADMPAPNPDYDPEKAARWQRRPR